MVVITDTPMYKVGQVSFALGPVVRELEFLSVDFDEIIWLGFDRSADSVNPIFDEISEKKITIIPVRPRGGQGIKNKFDIIFSMPLLLFRILNLIRSADVVHTRGPSSPAFFTILFSPLFKKKVWWNKYSGNWVQENPPFFYGLQKKLLLKLKTTKVSINGRWNNQLAHCVSFENPCLYEDDILKGAQICLSKRYKGKIEMVFVGRLGEEKGVLRILDFLKSNKIKNLAEFHFVGDGPNRKQFEAKAKEMDLKVTFHGFLNHSGVHELLRKSQFLLLPSASEGFPKVIAEASCYGCLPIVSDISSITHYVRHNENGFIWRINEKISFDDVVLSALRKPQHELQKMALAANEMAKDFGFENFRLKLHETVLDCEK